ncbi:hypothetical protein BVRB_8g182840 [Beta vulgaris subsp. vulgaris]|nr:hypothetical protein BVRB_8g182840 [Beta vulgaris subsp. vulgaris]
MASVASITGTVVGDTTSTRVMDHKVAAIAQDHQQHQQQQQQHQQHQQQLQQHQQQQQKAGNQEVLRCPRCDSTNTKFCYYNNYSLSQPRHFCKACKRYWTRGGTLRNVPVGGGCRKNKRVKRSSNNSSNSSNNSNIEVSISSASSGGGGGGGLNSLSSGGQIHDLISSSSNHVNHHQNHPLFYGLPTNHSANSDINYPFSRYDLQNPHQINGLGLGFSSGLVQNMDNMNIHHNHPQNTKQIFQDLISSSANNPMLSNYTNTTTTTTTTSPTISSLLASSIHQMKGANNNFQTLLPSYEDDLHMKGNGQNGMFRKEVKMEFEGQNRSFTTNHHHWNNNNPSNQNHQIMDQNIMSSSSDPSILWGTSGPNLGAWLDPSNNNLGSSVPSLI